MPRTMTTKTITMTAFAWLLLCLCCTCSTDGEQKAANTRCLYQCSNYVVWAHDCAVLAGCTAQEHGDEAAYDACVQPCLTGLKLCTQLCSQHYQEIKNTCRTNCENASIMAVDCEDDCFNVEFDATVGPSLPELTSSDQSLSQVDTYIEAEEEREEEEDEDLFGDLGDLGDLGDKEQSDFEEENGDTK